MLPQRRRGALAALSLLGVLVASGCTNDGPGSSADRPDAQVTTDAPVAVDPPSEAADGSPPPAPLLEVVRATSPRQASRQIQAAEDLIADRSTSGRDLRAAARLQQVAYRVLGTRPGWDAQVLWQLPRRLHAPVRANVAARREFRSMHSTLSDTLPAWRIVAPEPAAELKRYYRRAEARYGVGWEYLAAINLVETAMGRIRGTSVAGAQGPMQFIPTTWDRWGRGDINDPADSIMAAARYLASNGFARGPRGAARALFEYNNHPAYVRGVTHYARVMEADPRAFLAYHQWDVYYLTTEGDVRLPVGYERTRPVPVRKYLAAHPQR
jgi:membrane-bound lytic murein transglycosylase B